MDILVIIDLSLFSYLLGSISSAVIIGRIYLKDDVRNFGSGNAGMTNILRTAGKKAAVIVAVCDLAKGAIPVLLGRLLFVQVLGYAGIYGGYLAGFLAVIGHCFPLYFRFKGGKGVLTSAGAVICIDPLSVLVCAVIFFVTMKISRYVSLGSIVMAACFPFVSLGFSLLLKRDLWPVFGCSFIFALMIIWMHRSNIGRLVRHEENKIGVKVKTKV